MGDQIVRVQIGMINLYGFAGLYNFDGIFSELVIQDETLLSASNITDSVITIGNEYGPSSSSLTIASKKQTYSDTSANEQIHYAI